MRNVVNWLLCVCFHWPWWRLRESVWDQESQSGEERFECLVCGCRWEDETFGD